jgi:hypothetical protein
VHRKQIMCMYHLKVPIAKGYPSQVTVANSVLDIPASWEIVFAHLINLTFQLVNA